MARREPGGQLRTTQLYSVAVVQNTIYLSTGTAAGCAFHVRNIRVHDHEFRAGLLFDNTHAFIMVAVSMTDEDDLGVTVFEAELLNARANRRHVLLEIRIDQDVSLRS